MLMPIECIIFFLSIIINLCRIQSAGISKSSLTSATFVSACLYLLVHSLIPHKEHRFFLPVIPMLIPTIVNSLPRKNVGVSSFTIGALVMVNIGVSAYLGLFHQYGHKPTMDSLHEGMKRYPQGGRIAILTPCYALPFYSYLHPEGLKWNITQLNCIDPYKEVDGKVCTSICVIYLLSDGICERLLLPRPYPGNQPELGLPHRPVQVHCHVHRAL